MRLSLEKELFSYFDKKRNDSLSEGNSGTEGPTIVTYSKPRPNLASSSCQAGELQWAALPQARGLHTEAGSPPCTLITKRSHQRQHLSTHALSDNVLGKNYVTI